MAKKTAKTTIHAMLLLFEPDEDGWCAEHPSYEEPVEIRPTRGQPGTWAVIVAGSTVTDELKTPELAAWHAMGIVLTELADLGEEETLHELNRQVPWPGT